MMNEVTKAFVFGVEFVMVPITGAGIAGGVVALLARLFGDAHDQIWGVIAAFIALGCMGAYIYLRTEWSRIFSKETPNDQH